MNKILCPYCSGEIRQEDKMCDICKTQYFVNISKNRKAIFLQEINGNLIIPVAKNY